MIDNRKAAFAVFFVPVFFSLDKVEASGYQARLEKGNISY